MGSSYFPSKINMWLEILSGSLADASVSARIPITDYQSMFALNAIPTAIVGLAVGVNAAAPNQKAGAHGQTLTKLRGKYARVRCKLEGQAGVLDGQVVEWPSEEFSVFEGRVSGAGVEKSSGMATTIALEHWLIDLDNTNWASCLVDENSPDSPLKAGGYMQFNSSGTGGMPRLMATETLSGELVGKDNVWTDYLKKEFIRFAENKASTLDLRFLVNIGGSDTGTPNLIVKSVLEKMDDAAHMVIPNIQMLSKTPDALHLIQQFSSAIATIVFGSNDRPSFWSKLLRLLPHMGTALSPGVQTATVIPYTPVLRKEWMTVHSSDLTLVKSNARLDRELLGIALILQRNRLAFNPPSRPPTSPDGGVNNGPWGYVGWYSHKAIQDDGGNGRIGLRVAPPWFEGAYESRLFPGIAATNVSNPNKSVKPDTAEQELRRSMGDKLAKFMFMTESLQSRTFRVQSRLRFDAAPGSVIKIVGHDASYDAAGYSSKEMWGCVAQVTTSISTKEPSASTTWDLSHLRTADEDDMGINAHPMYNSYWRGSPLINLSQVTPALRT